MVGGNTIGSVDDELARRWFTLPNVITSLRILGSPGLILVAAFQQPIWFGCLVVFLVFTEWLDGFLARSMREESVIGARLDTVADAVFYACLLVAVTLLNPTVIARETIWIVTAIGCYLCSWIASWIKFHRLPSYHTWMAKGVWILVGTGIVCLLADWAVWPFRLAMICVVLTNLEAIVITIVLKECRVNVASLWHVLRSSVGVSHDSEAVGTPPSSE